MCFIGNDIDASLTNWCDMFLSAVDDHVPKSKSPNVYYHPWIDKELLFVIKKKDKQRKKAVKSGLVRDLHKFKEIRRQTKSLIAKKRKDHAINTKESLSENPINASGPLSKTPRHIVLHQTFVNGL